MPDLRSHKELTTTLAVLLALGGVPAPAIAETGSSSASTSTSNGSSGDTSGKQQNSDTPPEPPSGEQNGEAAGGNGNGSAPSGEAPGGEAPTGEPPAGDPPAGAPDNANGAGGPGGGGADTQKFDYTGSYSATKVADGTSESVSGETVSATDSDQNAALAQNGGTLTLDATTLTKSGDDTDGDRCNFYGANSIALAVGENSLLKIGGGTLTADSEGSNGVFATDGATALVSDTSITTTAGNSRGLDATYGGTVIADGVTIKTSGDHCAAVATDRGGGTISVTDSSFSTEGSGSPLLYSTGAIEVDGVTGTSSGSQIAGMEGLNSISISNSTLTSTITDKTASDPVADGVIIYQSTSGDAETSTGEAARFQAVDSTLKSSIQTGAMFYVTNTTANVVLQNTKLDFDSTNAKLLYAAGNDANSWGTPGKNGATVNLTGIGQTLAGDVTADTASTAALYLLEGTTWTGAASIEKNSAVEDGTSAPLTVNVSSDSTWTVTADSTVTNLNIESGGKIVDSAGNKVSVVANGEKVVEGDSTITVTVTGAYGTDFETSEANQIADATADRSAFNEAFSKNTKVDVTSDGINPTDPDSATATTDQTQTSDGSGTSLLDMLAGAWNAIVSFFTGK